MANDLIDHEDCFLCEFDGSRPNHPYTACAVGILPTTTTYLLSIDWRYNEFYILLHQHKYQYSEWTVQIRFPKP